MSAVERQKSHLLIAANPKSGAVDSRALVTALCEETQKAGFETEICDSLDYLRDRSAELSAAGLLRGIVSAGGDGTVSAVVNRVPPLTPIYVFPLGTENLLAKHLGFTTDVSQAVRTISAAETHTIDAGLAGDKLFLVMFSAGFDAAVVRAMHSSRKGHIRQWSYAKPILNTLRKYTYPELKVDFWGTSKPLVDWAGTIVDPPRKLPGKESQVAQTYLDGESLNGQADGSLGARWLFVFNLPRYAAGLQFAPDAKFDDQMLDACLFRHGGFWSGIRYFAYVVMGWHRKMPENRMVCCRKILVTADIEVPYQIDGDPGGVLPVELSVLPNHICLFKPQ